MSGEKSQPTLSILRGNLFNVAASNEFPEGQVAKNH